MSAADYLSFFKIVNDLCNALSCCTQQGVLWVQVVLDSCYEGASCKVLMLAASLGCSRVGANCKVPMPAASLSWSSTGTSCRVLMLAASTPWLPSLHTLPLGRHHHFYPPKYQTLLHSPYKGSGWPPQTSFAFPQADKTEFRLKDTFLLHLLPILYWWLFSQWFDP